MCKFKEIVKKHRNGATIDLFVTTGSKNTVFPAAYNKWRKRLEIKVKSKAKSNKANEEIIITIADFLNKKTREISIISGEKSREKTLLVLNVSSDYIIKKLMGQL